MRHTEFEFWFFLLWFAIGMLAFLILPPIKKDRDVCCLTINTNMGWALVATQFLFWLCLTFCFYMVLSSFLYDFDKHITDLPQLVNGNRLFWVPLLISFAASTLMALATMWSETKCLGCCCRCLPRTWWSTAALGLVITYYVRTTFPCSEDSATEDEYRVKMCFYIRFLGTLVGSMIVSGLLAAAALQCIGDIVFELQEHITIGFTVALSLMVMSVDYDYWQTHTTYYPLIAMLVAALIRFAVVSATQYCKCFRAGYTRVSSSSSSMQ